MTLKIKAPPETFCNRTQVASFFGVSRMTIYRWEKIHPLPNRSVLNKHYITVLIKDFLITWYREMINKVSQHDRFRHNRAVTPRVLLQIYPGYKV